MKRPKVIYSQYQKDIFENIQNGSGNTVVFARAGCGKSFCLIEGVKYIPKKLKSLFVAFNTSVAKELDERISKSYISARTLHSVGRSTIVNTFGKIVLDPDKSLNIIQNILHKRGYKKFDKEKFNIASSLLKAVNLCKGCLIDIPSKIDILLDEFDIDTFELSREEFINIICQSLRECKEVKNVIDYGDMIWLPYVYGMRFKQYDRVFIDEAHDLNAAQLHIALNSCKKGGRILAVLDDFQVLYSFTGVKIDAADILIKRLNAKVLPLPISYRCPKAVIKLAQEIVPDIQAAPNAKEGEVKVVLENVFLSLVRPGDFILSRVNAPLIYYCMELIRNKIPANIAGRDIGRGLAYLVRKSETKTVNEFLKWLGKWKQEEIDRLKQKGRDPVIILDKAACLENLCGGKKTTDQIIDDINELFSDADANDIVVLSSIHRAKGLERDNVFLLDFTLRRGMNRSEDNIAYVGFTRARKSLFLVRKG